MPSKWFSLVLLLIPSVALGQGQENNFSKAVGDFKAAPIKPKAVYPMPVLTWGGDVATLFGNGGTNTTKDSIFGKAGLNYKIVSGDDVIQQARDVLSGETPFFRGTFTMMLEASEKFGESPDTQMVILFQETYSQGDHMVSRTMKNLNDLKSLAAKRKVKGCLQRFGPHTELVDVALKSTDLVWQNLEVVWAKNLTGPDSPAEMMRKDPTIDFCCVITPDMEGLTGGMKSVGTKEGQAEGNIEGARVFFSTVDANHSINDQLAVRADYFKSHREECEKLSAAYLKSVEQLLAAKQVYNNGKAKSDTYFRALTLAQTFYGKEVLPNLETTTHGLVEDAIFVRLAGNISFFNDPGNLNGFAKKQKEVLDTLQTLGYITKEGRSGVELAHWDWQEVAKLAGIPYAAPKPMQGKIAAEDISLFPDSNLDDRTIVSFTIQFEPNQQDFPIDTYAADMKKVIQALQTFGNCMMVTEGHSDTTKVLVDFIKAGMKNGSIQRVGSQTDGFGYSYKGKMLDLNATADVITAIQAGDFNGTDVNPQATMQAATNLSMTRAQAVNKVVIEYAKASGLNLDPTQMQALGVGIRRPIIAKPLNSDQSKKNMRVQFRLIRVPAEAIKSDEFDLLGK